MKTLVSRVMVLSAAWQLVGCVVSDEPQVSSTQGESFEEFRASTYKENWAGGHFIVDGDTPIPDEKQLYEFWAAQTQGGLVINKVGSADDRWNDTQKLDLTYCVSNNFGSNKSAVVAALEAATTNGWETRANVNFVYASAQDGSCTVSNNSVLFNVRQVSGQPYLARAFFPSNNRASREVLVDTSSFGNTGWPLSHVLGHELGHVLGFRHEHTRPEAATCFEDNSWRPLTPYDSGSIMHYPQCNGSSNDSNWTAKDAEGAASVYGAPAGGGGTNPPPPPPPPTGGTAKSETQAGSVAQGAATTYGTYAVKPGTTFTVTMSGTGDPDLYVRFGAAPTTAQFDCRPYIDGPDETCSLTVPANETAAHIMVHGYTAATYSLAINWTAP